MRVTDSERVSLLAPPPTFTTPARTLMPPPDAPMDLEEFTKRALVQLVAGVQGAVTEIVDANPRGRINPPPDGGRPEPLTQVEFDVAVTAQHLLLPRFRWGITSPSAAPSGQT